MMSSFTMLESEILIPISNGLSKPDIVNLKMSIKHFFKAKSKICTHFFIKTLISEKENLWNHQLKSLRYIKTKGRVIKIL